MYAIVVLCMIDTMYGSRKRCMHDFEGELYEYDISFSVL